MTDMLLFRRAPDLSGGQLSCPWTGPWPPPMAMTLITNPATGAAVAFDADHLEDAPALTIFELDPDLTVERYYRYSASEIPVPARPDERWFRGAQYVPGEPPAEVT